MRSPSPAALTPSSPAHSPAAPPLALYRPAGWWWLLPWLGLLLGAPLWLHWYEPAQFVALNAACAQWAPPVVWAGLSMLGNGWGVLCLTAPLLLYAPRLMLAWLCAAPFAVLVARGGKALITSPRPAALIDNAQFHILGERLDSVSMPSGHTTTAFAVAVSLWLALGARARHAWLLLLAAGAGLSRIAVGAHWPGDVAVGACAGMLCALLGHALLGRLQALPAAWAARVGQRLLQAALLLVGLAVYYQLTETLDFAQNQPLQYLCAAVGALSVLAVGLRLRRNPALLQPF